MKPMKNNHMPDQLKLYAVVRPDGTTVKIVTDEESARRAVAEDLRNQLSPEEFAALRSCMMKGERSPEADRLIRTVDSYKVELVHSRKLKKGELARLLADHKAEEPKRRAQKTDDQSICRLVEMASRVATVFGDMGATSSEAAHAMAILLSFLAHRNDSVHRRNIIELCRDLADRLEAPESE
jgi:hypothetical protein